MIKITKNEVVNQILTIEGTVIVKSVAYPFYWAGAEGTERLDVQVGNTMLVCSFNRNAISATRFDFNLDIQLHKLILRELAKQRYFKTRIYWQ